MRFSAALLATAAIITPAVLAASGTVHHSSARRGTDHGLGVRELDFAEGLLKVRGVDLGHINRRDGEMPGQPDGKKDGIMMEPSPKVDLAPPAEEGQSNSSPPTATEQTSPESSPSGPTPDNDDAEMLDPSSMPSPSPSPSPSSGEEAGYPGARGYIRARSLDARQDDGDDDEESYAETRCDSDSDEDCDDARKGDSAEQGDNEEQDSANAKYLAKTKRAREQHMKTTRANHTLKQASRREVVERSKLGRRAGSRPSASARPPT